jgi:hypothetical protein
MLLYLPRIRLSSIRRKTCGMKSVKKPSKTKQRWRVMVSDRTNYPKFAEVLANIVAVRW